MNIIENGIKKIISIEEVIEVKNKITFIDWYGKERTKIFNKNKNYKKITWVE